MSPSSYLLISLLTASRRRCWFGLLIAGRGRFRLRLPRDLLPVFFLRYKRTRRINKFERTSRKRSISSRRRRSGGACLQRGMRWWWTNWTNRSGRIPQAFDEQNMDCR